MGQTGRIKGDVILKTGKRAVFTFEYRDDKDQFVLGAHGGENGLKFIQFLRENLTKCIICPEENE